MKKIHLLAATLTLFMCACAPSSYYQLYKVSTNGLQQKDNRLTFENEDCIISYNLWGEHGDLSFILFNKTDKNLFVVMPKSFFIQNGMAYDYYTNAVHTSRIVTQNGSATTYSNAFASILGSSGYASGRAATHTQASTLESTKTSVEMTLICIPPQAAKYFQGFTLVEHVHKDCDDYEFNYPKKVSDIITYDKEDSPWTFRNRIAYTLDGDNEECKYIENELWVSYLQNYYYTKMEEQIKVTECEMNIPTTKTIILNQAPNAFYNSYSKTIGATKGGTAKRFSAEREPVNDELYDLR